MKENDNIHGEGKSISALGDKNILTIERNLLLDIGILVCNASNYYNAFSNESALYAHHTLQIIYPGKLKFQTDRFDIGVTHYDYTIFIASIS